MMALGSFRVAGVILVVSTLALSGCASKGSIEVRHDVGDLNAPRAHLCAGLALALADWSSEPEAAHADVRSDPGGGSRLFEGEIESAKYERFLWTCDVRVLEDELSAQITELKPG